MVLQRRISSKKGLNIIQYFYLHRGAHGVAEVDHDEGDNSEPLLLGEAGHAGVF